MSKSDSVKLGTLISATMRPVDLIPAFMNELIRREKKDKLQDILEAAHEQWPDNSDEENFIDGRTMGRALIRNTSIGSSAIESISADTSADWWNESFDNGAGWTNDQENTHTIEELVDALNEDLPNGFTFGTHEGDGSDYGYWATSGDEEDAGNEYFWEPHYGNLLITQKETGHTQLLQGDDQQPFLQQTGQVNAIWANDPENKEGRTFATLEEHLDAIAQPYFDIT